MEKKNSWDIRYEELLKIRSRTATNKYISGSLDIKEGEQILYLGCNNIEPIRFLKAKGAEILVLCLDESNLINLRREGVGAILMNAEYIPYENRFDRVIAEDILFPIDCPSMAFENIISSLKPEGEAVIEMIIDDGNLFLKELTWQILKENGYMYSLYSPSYFRKDKLIELIPTDKLKKFNTQLRYKSEVITLKKGFDWLKPYLKIASAHLLKSQQEHFQRLMRVTLERNLQNTITSSLVMEYTLLRIDMQKL